MVDLYDANSKIISCHNTLSEKAEISPGHFKSLKFSEKTNFAGDELSSFHWGNLLRPNTFPKWRDHWDYKGSAPIGESALVIPVEKNGGTKNGRVFRIILNLSCYTDCDCWTTGSAVGLLIEAYYFDDTGKEPVLKDQIHFEPYEFLLVGVQPGSQQDFKNLKECGRAKVQHETFVKLSPNNNEYKQYISFIVTNRTESPLFIDNAKDPASLIMLSVPS